MRPPSTEDDLRAALGEVVDPELGINVVDLGLVYGMKIDEGVAMVTMTMTTPACPLRDYIVDLVESAVRARLPDVQRVVVDIVDEPPWSEEMMSDAARRQLR